MWVNFPCVCLPDIRQNRKERKNKKRWSHINPDLIGPLDEKEVSLTVRSSRPSQWEDS